MHLTYHDSNEHKDSVSTAAAGGAGAPADAQNEDRPSLLAKAVSGFRLAVIELERIAQEANRASDRARRTLTMLELECEDEADFTAAGTTVYLEPLQSPDSNPGSQVNRDGNER